VDGGARGNPGPAAAAAVVSDARGEVLDEAAVLLGDTTNNVAEYRGLLLGLERARALGADAVEVVNDSELVAKQVNGVYKVRSPDMRALHAQALAALGEFERWAVRSVPRAENAAADALVNRALDGEPPPRADGADGDDPLPAAVARAEELWCELILHELSAARDALQDGAPDVATPHLRRAVAVERLLLEQLTVLAEAGLPALASEPRSLRAVEWLSGERAARPGAAAPPAGASLYEAFSAGLGLPEERRARLAALTALEREGDSAWQRAAELLRAHGEGLARWRADDADSAAGRRFFPELWEAAPSAT
jgi:ribonuclease HI